jgi:hypothetical protein
MRVGVEVMGSLTEGVIVDVADVWDNVTSCECDRRGVLVGNEVTVGVIETVGVGLESRLR